MFAAPSSASEFGAKENLNFHPGAADGTPHKKRNRLKPRLALDRSPLGAPEAAESSSSAAAPAPPAPVQVTLTQEQLSALTPEERALIEKLSARGQPPPRPA